MIKIAFVKYGGLSAGGTEVHLQTVAANLPKNNFLIDYFYCDATRYIGSDWVHPDTDIYRKKYLESKEINLIKFDVEAKDITVKTHPWVNTNFWEKFSEDNYDVIISARAGDPEYPFTKILNKPLIFFITLNAGVDNQSNIYRNILISNWQSKQWIKKGGDINRMAVYPLLKELTFQQKNSLENKKNKFVYGFHQRDNDQIFSEVPLLAYKKIMNKDTEFKILGGSKKYSLLANKLNLINFKQLEHSGDDIVIGNFLSSLDVYTHGRSDGETFGQVFVEAMYHNLPIVSHRALNNAQIEVIGNAGKVFSKKNILGYSLEMRKLKNNKKYYDMRSYNASNRYETEYSLDANIGKLVFEIEQAVNLKS